MYIIIIIIIIIIIKYKNLKEKQNSSYLSNDFRIKKKKKIKVVNCIITFYNEVMNQNIELLKCVFFFKEVLISIILQKLHFQNAKDIFNYLLYFCLLILGLFTLYGNII